MTALQELEAAVCPAEAWVADLTRRLGWRDPAKVYRGLLATLRALRDDLPADEVVYLGEHMPALLRGLYYEGWHPTRRAAADKSREAFLARIHDGVHRDPGIDPEQVAHAVFALLADRLPAAELDEVRAATPNGLHNLWPS